MTFSEQNMRRYRTDNRLDITEYEITTDNAHLSTPLTIALIADLHDRPYEKIMVSLSDRKPDIIAIAGDLIDGYTADGMDNRSHDYLTHMPESVLAKSAHALQFLKDCAALAPTYYGLGNHEWLLSDYDYELIKNSGALLLDNSSTGFSSVKNNTVQSPQTAPRISLPVISATDNDHKILIGGLTSSAVMRYREYILQNPDMAGYYPLFPPKSWWKRKRNTHPHLDYEWLGQFNQQDGFKILLCHHPEYWMHKDPVLSEMNIDITMSGHAHGGQIRLLRHGLFSPGQGIFPKYTHGLHRGKHGVLVVSRGLANTTWIPRIGNCPEIVYAHIANLST